MAGAKAKYTAKQIADVRRVWLTAKVLGYWPRKGLIQVVARKLGMPCQDVRYILDFHRF